MDRTEVLIYLQPNLNIVTHHGRGAIHLEMWRLIFAAGARRLFWHTQIDETSLDQICG